MISFDCVVMVCFRTSTNIERVFEILLNVLRVKVDVEFRDASR